MGKKLTAKLFKAFVFAGGAAMLLGAPKGAAADNLSDAMIGAYKTSGLLEQNRALLRATDENVAAAVARLRPVVDWVARAERNYLRNGFTGGASSNHDTTVSTGIDVSWLLFDNGVSRLSQMAAQETVLATRQALIDIEQQVLFAAVQAYVNVLLQQDNVALRSNNLRLLQEELRAANDRFEVGEVTRTDVALAESRVAAAQASLTESRGALLDAQAVYVQAVGSKPGRIAGQPPLPSASPRCKRPSPSPCATTQPSLPSNTRLKRPISQPKAQAVVWARRSRSAPTLRMRKTPPAPARVILPAPA